MISRGSKWKRGTTTKALFVLDLALAVIAAGCASVSVDFDSCDHTGAREAPIAVGPLGMAVQEINDNVYQSIPEDRQAATGRLFGR